MVTLNRRLRNDRRDFGRADKLASTSSPQGWTTGGDKPNLGSGVPES